VVVVESPFSVVKATALGVDTPVLATFGAKVSEAQIKLLADYHEVVVWADPDTAGVLMQRRLAKALHRETTVRVVTPDEGKDMGDCENLDEVKGKIEAAVPAVTVLAAL
jgi:DNA primase